LAGLEDESGAKVEWTESDLQFVAEQLVSSFGEYQPPLRELLRPLAAKLVPVLDTLFDAENSTANQQEHAAMALADYAADDGEQLAKLLTRATQRQTEILYPKVAEFKTGKVREMLLALTKEQPDENLGQQDRVRLGRRRANAAIALLRQGERDAYFGALRITTDPESLSQFVSRCKNWGVTAQELVESLERSQALRAAAVGVEKRLEARVMYGLLLALGNYSPPQVPEASREKLIEELKRLYGEDPSAAVHGASGWLLRQWGQEAAVAQLDEVEVGYDASGEREWFRWRVSVVPNAGGLFGLFGAKGKPQTFSLTFVVFPAGEYRIGSQEPDRVTDWGQRLVNISRPVALCDREVKWELYDAYEGDQKRSRYGRQFAWEPGAQDAAFGVDWYEWVSFCRWLTVARFGESERFQCYEDPDTLQKDGNFNPIFGALKLDRCGFRMPTESEWELCAGGRQETPWSFGSDVGLMVDYGWFEENSGKRPHGVCLKRPSLGGLYDVHGNVYEWVHDLVLLDPQGVRRGHDRVLRGGGWDSAAADCRMADRYWFDPANRNVLHGLRLALSPSVIPPEAEATGDKTKTDN
jgi:formylglycine-generating enzyme required for sulfatase activity